MLSSVSGEAIFLGGDELLASSLDGSFDCGVPWNCLPCLIILVSRAKENYALEQLGNLFPEPCTEIVLAWCRI